MSSKTATTISATAGKAKTAKPRANKKANPLKGATLVFEDGETETINDELLIEKKIETDLNEKVETIIETENETMSAKKIIYESESEDETEPVVESEDESEDEEAELAKKLEEILKKKREKERVKALSEYRKPENCRTDIKNYVSEQKAKLRNLCAINGIEEIFMEHHDYEITDYLFGECSGWEAEFDNLTEKLYNRKNRVVATTTTTKKVAKKTEKTENDEAKTKIARRELSEVFTKKTEFKYVWEKGAEYVGIYDPAKKVITWDGHEFSAVDNLNGWINGAEKTAGNSVADLRGQKTSKKNAWVRAFYKTEKNEWKKIDELVRL